MRSRRFIVLTSLLGVTLLAWLLSYPLGTMFQWSQVSWGSEPQSDTLVVRYREFQYADGNLFLGLGKFNTRFQHGLKGQWQQFASHFPRFKRTSPQTYRWSGSAWAIGGLGINHVDNGALNSWQFGLPFWLPASLFLIIPLRVAFRRWLAVDRRRHGLCPNCGYDLRATAGVCPECGGVPEAQLLAAECGPAILATARSSGTKGVLVLAIYFTAATVLAAEGFAHWQAPVLARAAVIAGAMVVILAGAFHAASFSRSGEALFGFGSLAALLLFPLYIRLGEYTPPAVQIGASLAGVLLMGLLARTCGSLNWRRQQRANARQRAAVTRVYSEV